MKRKSHFIAIVKFCNKKKNQNHIEKKLNGVKDQFMNISLSFKSWNQGPLTFICELTMLTTNMVINGKFILVDLFIS